MRLLKKMMLVTLMTGWWPAVAGGAEPYETLRKQIDAILTDKGLQNVKQSVRVVDCVDGKVVYSYRAQETLAPASNAKLLVSAAATELLGPGFEYETVIWGDGKVKQGVLNGNLVLRGSGDPNFSGRFHDGDVNFIPRSWARDVVKTGIKRITGDLVCDDTLFDRQTVNPFWTERDQQNWYAPQVSALSFNDNCLDLYLAPGAKAGDPAKVTTEPNTRYVKIINTCKTSDKSKANPAVWRPLGANDLHVSGSIWLKSGQGRHWIPIHEPALYLGTVFTEELSRAGVKVEGKVRLIEGVGQSVKATDERTVVVFRSSLVPTMAVMNKRSLPVHAETMLKLLGARFGQDGSFASGVKVVEKFLTEKVKVTPGTVRLVDGSGLADQNRCSATVFTEVLRYMKGHPDGKMFVESLSISGVDGTLLNRLAQPPYRGNILGKTGRIASVRSLSGYVNAKSGKVYAFAMLAGGVTDEGPVNRAHEAVARALYNQ